MTDQAQSLIDNWYVVYDRDDEGKPSLAYFLESNGIDPVYAYDAQGNDAWPSWAFLPPAPPVTAPPLPPPPPATPGRVMEPDQVAGYNAWLADGAVGSPPDWVEEDRALIRAQQAEAARALAVLADQPAQIRATFDLGGQGYGSALSIVTLADQTGVLPSAVVQQVPGAATVNTTINPDDVNPKQPLPTPGSNAGTSGFFWLIAGLGLWALRRA